jgi:hypothetical protein
MSISYLPLQLALLVLLLPSYGVSITIIKLVLLLDTPLYSEAPSIIFMRMDAKMDGMSSECFRQVMGLSSGFSTTLELLQALHIA